MTGNTEKLYCIRMGDTVGFTWDGVRCWAEVIGWITTLLGGGQPYCIVSTDNRLKHGRPDRAVALSAIFERTRGYETLCWAQEAEPVQT